MLMLMLIDIMQNILDPPLRLQKLHLSFHPYKIKFENFNDNT